MLSVINSRPLHSYQYNHMFPTIVAGTVSREPALALQNSQPGTLQGFSVTPEGINQNWIAYELMLETPWREQPLSAAALSSWVEGYARRRGPSRAQPASRSLRRALLTPQVNPGSRYHCGKRN